MAINTIFHINPCFILYKNRKQKLFTTAIASLAILSMTITFYIHPTFSSHNKFMAASRYLFWNEWVIIILMSLGWYNIFSLFKTKTYKISFLVISLLIITTINIPLFNLYYRMNAKTGNYSGLQHEAENISGNRLMVLANGYDMQYIKHYWPTNCSYASAPIYGGKNDFKLMHIKDCLINISQTYPNIVLQLNRLNNYSGTPIKELDTIFVNSTLITNGTELVLRELGVNPNEVTRDIK